MPDGVYRSEIWNNPLGTPLRYPVKVTVQGDEIEVDFDGRAARSCRRAALNCTLSYTAAHATYPLEVHAVARPCAAMPACYRPLPRDGAARAASSTAPSRRR